MDDKHLWEEFQKTGRIADYLRYRGVDIYAASNTVAREETPDVHNQRTGNSPSDRGARHPRI